MAVAGRPQLLVADEPTTALDVKVQAQVLGLIRKLADDQGMAVLLISHDLGVVAGFASRVAVMRGGKIVEDSPVMEFYRSPRHPYSQQLLRSTPRVDAPFPSVASDS
jgi:ABC-type dipeptide/oligopeptide/nickel transport system ATPase component